MTCPICGYKTIVIDSTYMIDSVTRKRKCNSCGHKFYTEELEVKEGATVITRHQQAYKEEQQ